MSLKIMITAFQKFLKSIFGEKKAKFRVQTKHAIEEAFVIEGIKYFQFKDDLTTVPTARMFGAMTVYNEMEMKVDYDYLKTFCKAMDKILDTPPVKVREIVTIHNHLKERLELMIMPDYIYKLASVVFFDESENPYEYDHEHAQKKIERWKRNKDVLPFFLSSPIKKLIPYLESLPKDLNLFLPVINQIDGTHRESLTKILSGK